MLHKTLSSINIMTITSEIYYIANNYSTINILSYYDELLLGDHLRVVCGATESNPHGILDHHMLVIAVLDNATLQVIHYTGEEEEKVQPTVQEDPSPAEEDSVWNRLTGVLGGTDDTAKNESRTHDPPPAEDSVWNRFTSIFGGTDDTAMSESRTHDPPPAEDSVWNRLTGVFGGTDDTAEHQEQHESHAHDERTRGGGMAVREQKIKIDVKAEKVELLKYPEKDDLKLYLPDEAIKRARSRLDEKEYGLFQNNCECFVNWAITGESISNQVESGKWATALGATVGVVSGYWKEGSFMAAAKGAVSGAKGGFQYYRQNRY